MRTVSQLNEVELENITATLTKVNEYSDTRKLTIADIVNYTDYFNYVEFVVADVVAATMISFYGRKLKVNGGINNECQLGWITKLANGNYSVTCH